MKRFLIFAIVSIAILSGCTKSGGKSGGGATAQDLYIGGISNNSLMLEGAKGSTKTFSIRANYAWEIIEYKGFSCEPSSGAKTNEDDVINVTATALQANNSADTVYLSALNFRLLSTRFYGISAYQLPQVRLTKGDKIYLNATSGSTSSIKFVSSSDDIELVARGNFSASLGEKNSRNEYTITVSTDNENSAVESQNLGSIGFRINGAMQESKIEVIQSSAIVYDRNEVILPSKVGGENMFVVDSSFDVTASVDSELFEIEERESNSFVVRAKVANTSNQKVYLGNVDIYLTDSPNCRVSLGVYQRKAKAPQTIIVHFIGTALQHYFNYNITKFLQALNSNIQGDAQVMVITTDSTNDATLYELRYDAILGKAVQEKVKKLSLPTPYDSALFEANLREALEFAPAEKYALIIGSHGLAWVPKSPSTAQSLALRRLGLSHEDLWKRNEGAEMTRHLGDKTPTRYDITEIATAIEANNVKFDYILFDACFMGNVESAYDLRNSTKYIIGSPCEVMGYGFPYAKIVQYMLADGGTSYNLDKICNEYVHYYKTEATTPSACVALTNTSELKALAQAMKAVNNAGVKPEFSLSKVQYYEGQAVHSFYDLGDMVKQSCADSAVATAFKEQLDKTVTSRYHTKQFYSAYGSNNKYYHDINYYSGISTSAMVEHYSTDWQQTAWYKATH